jgi:hypothetical protein
VASAHRGGAGGGDKAGEREEAEVHSG